MTRFVLAFLLFFATCSFGQENELAKQDWCFAANFLDSISEEDTLTVYLFYYDNSPIRFKDNGKFKRIKPPLTSCGRFGGDKLDELRGKWNLHGNRLTMKTRSTTVSFGIIAKTESVMTLSVLRISQ